MPIAGLSVLRFARGQRASSPLIHSDCVAGCVASRIRCMPGPRSVDGRHTKTSGSEVAPRRHAEATRTTSTQRSSIAGARPRRPCAFKSASTLPPVGRGRVRKSDERVEAASRPRGSIGASPSSSSTKAIFRPLHSARRRASSAEFLRPPDRCLAASRSLVRCTAHGLCRTRRSAGNGW
jgi:hypothetical protein